MTTEQQIEVACTVNGKPHECVVATRLLLSDFLRHELRLTGTHVGCEHGVCGACTVLVDGRAVRSCLLLAAQAEGATIVTIEGLAAPGADLHPLQRAFVDHGAFQCGFCTAGILLAAVDFVGRTPSPSRQDVAELLSGHLCRCTGYFPIVDAIIDYAARNEPGRR